MKNKFACVLLLLVVTAMLLTGCGNQGVKEGNSVTDAVQQEAEPKA